MNTGCKSCGSGAVRPFYAVGGIPVHSCLLMATRDDALAYPTRDLELGFCESCGFVENIRFDRSVHEYSTRYEETQAFSPRFNEFSRALCERLVRSYGLRGKSILEIGCGKGEWLVTMCEVGAMHGIGIDPGYRPERTKSPAGERIEWIQDFYGPSYSHLQADVVACRHTLEHIDTTHEFVELVRRTIGDRTDTLVFFEVPDVYRVLEEQAFQDIYYEHCSYFSLGSLARLFRRCGFDVVELWTDFDDQYLMLCAKPGDGSGGERFAAEDDLARMTQATLKFEHEFPVRRDAMRADLARWIAAGQRVVLWGSGSKAVAYLTTLGIRDELDYVVDINPHKHGKFLAGTGHEIVAPDSLREIRPDVVVVMNPIYVDEIRADCSALGLEPELVPI